MNNVYWRKYFLLFVGIVVIAFGVVLLTKASLGTSPIAAIPYSLSLVFPQLTFGNWLIVFCLTLIAAQVVLERFRCRWVDIGIELLLSFVFGNFIDFAMYCLQWFHPVGYVWCMVSLLMGCVVLAYGAFIEIVANVAMLPIDAIERTLSTLIGREYAQIRIVADITMSVTAAVLCYLTLHNFAAVREGTVIAAIITGAMVKWFVKINRKQQNRP